MGAGASTGGGGLNAGLDAFTCPITGDIMCDPVITLDGHTYERAAIEEWFNRGHRTSPLTGLPLPADKVTSNVTLKKAISEYLVSQLGNNAKGLGVGGRDDDDDDGQHGKKKNTASSSIKAAPSAWGTSGSSSSRTTRGLLLGAGGGKEQQKGSEEERLERSLQRAAARAGKVKLLLTDPDTASPYDWLSLQTKLPASEVKRYAAMLRRDGASSMALFIDAGYSREDLHSLGVRQPHIASILRAVREYKRKTGLRGPEDEEEDFLLDHLASCDDHELADLRRKLRRAAGSRRRSSSSSIAMSSSSVLEMEEGDDGMEDEEEDDDDDHPIVRPLRSGFRSSSSSLSPHHVPRRSSRDLREATAEALRMIREELDGSAARQSQHHQQDSSAAQQLQAEDEEDTQERVVRAFLDSPVLLRAAAVAAAARRGTNRLMQEEVAEEEVMDIEEEGGDGEVPSEEESNRGGAGGRRSADAAGGPPVHVMSSSPSYTVATLVRVAKDQLSSSLSSAAIGSDVATLLEALHAMAKLACSLGPQPAAFVRMACNLRRLGMELNPDVGQDAHLRHQLGLAGAVEVVMQALREHGTDNVRVCQVGMLLVSRLILDDDNKDRLLMLLLDGEGEQEAGLTAVSLFTTVMARHATDPDVQGNGCLILADLDGSIPSYHHHHHFDEPGAAASGAARGLRTEDMARILEALRSLPGHRDVQVCGLAACARLSENEDGSRASLYGEARELLQAAKARFPDDHDLQLIVRTVEQLIVDAASIAPQPLSSRSAPMTRALASATRNSG